MPYVDLAGVETYYEVEGAGKPLLLLHGGLVTIDALRAQREALAPRFRVWLPERRGHGRTPDVEGPVTFDAMTADTLTFMDAMRIERADVVGHSDGAIVGLLLAIRHAERVARLVSISANFDPSGVVPDEPPADSDGVAAKLHEMWRREPRITLHELASIRAPTLVMAGDADSIRHEHTVELYRAIPDARLAIVAGAGHDLITTKPQLVNATILDFLA